ncbi:hypothetical protein [Alienimonas sp. DA493]|uniref:hypothetical protein n=1 Tax=Alienimonas sp. DA493 TaxID=3373605 RepID=UPI0037552345
MSWAGGWGWCCCGSDACDVVYENGVESYPIPLFCDLTVAVLDANGEHNRVGNAYYNYCNVLTHTVSGAEGRDENCAHTKTETVQSRGGGNFWDVAVAANLQIHSLHGTLNGSKHTYGFRFTLSADTNFSNPSRPIGSTPYRSSNSTQYHYVVTETPEPADMNNADWQAALTNVSIPFDYYHHSLGGDAPQTGNCPSIADAVVDFSPYFSP